MAIAAGFAATQALAQAPSDAQRNAIKSSCRSDYMAHCSSVPPGGAASVQCLQTNMASLSAGCQTALRAIEPAAEAKPAAAPATESKPAAAEPSRPVAEPSKSVAQPAAPAAPVAASKP
ncbi:MAG: cysteine rich repeat-containing protein, partial [Bradyrhizobium sp.]